MELASKYDPKEVESKWYQYWLDNKLFSSKPDDREPYTIVVPPPNVTGVLQDVLAWKAKMLAGFQAPTMPPLLPRQKS